KRCGVLERSRQDLVARVEVESAGDVAERFARAVRKANLIGIAAQESSEAGREPSRLGGPVGGGPRRSEAEALRIAGSVFVRHGGPQGRSRTGHKMGRASCRGR